MNISMILQKMIEASDRNLHDINHLLKVHGFARMIGILEGLDAVTQERLEIAAIVHDIACPLCRKKYGSTRGDLQEKEGGALTRAFLSDKGLSEETIERVAWLVSHHHTEDQADGPDYQILLEADYLVNADEGHESEESRKRRYDTMFRTETGKALMRAIYPGDYEENTGSAEVETE